MKKIICAALACSIIAISSQSLAKTNDNSLAYGWYCTAQFGWAYYDDVAAPPGKTGGTSGLSYGIGAGYADFINKKFSWRWQATLDNYGEWLDKNNSSSIIRGFSALGGAGYQFNSRTNYTALLGMSLINGASLKLHPTFGILAEYAFAGNITARVQYTYTIDVMGGLNNLSFGLAYYF